MHAHSSLTYTARRGDLKPSWSLGTDMSPDLENGNCMFPVDARHGASSAIFRWLVVAVKRVDSEGSIPYVQPSVSRAVTQAKAAPSQICLDRARSSAV